MKLDGILFIEVPNCDNPQMLYDSVMLDPEPSQFTRKSLESLFKKTHFKLVKLESVYFDLLHSSKAQKARMFLRFRLFSKDLFKESPDKKGTVCRAILQK